MIVLMWVFCFCVGSLVFSVTNLKLNHECTYVFSISKVSQLDLPWQIDISNRCIFFNFKGKLLSEEKLLNFYSIYFVKRGYIYFDDTDLTFNFVMIDYSQELQLSTTIILFLSILLVFTSYGLILRKFYNSRKKFEALKIDTQEGIAIFFLFQSRNWFIFFLYIFQFNCWNKIKLVLPSQEQTTSNFQEVLFTFSQ